MPTEVRLPLDQLTLLADLIAARLGQDQGHELLSATELAQRLGRTKWWVYEHRDELGALRVGDAGHLLFEWPQVLDRLRSRSMSERSQAQIPSNGGAVRRRAPRAMGSDPDFLPIGRRKQAR